MRILVEGCRDCHEKGREEGRDSVYIIYTKAERNKREHEVIPRRKFSTSR